MILPSMILPPFPLCVSLRSPELKDKSGQGRFGTGGVQRPGEIPPLWKPCPSRTWIVSNTIKRTITHWIPAVFCAFISLIALFASVRSPDSGWWRPAFFAFLPMCFFFVGSATTQMHRELRELRQRITELEQKRAS